MRILFIGDIVGSPGRTMVRDYLPKLKDKYHPMLLLSMVKTRLLEKVLPKNLQTIFRMGSSSCYIR